MKIEVGDKVNTIYSYGVEVLEINKEEGRISFKNHHNEELTTSIHRCELVKKGEKKMEKYTGFEVIERMNQGGILQLTGDRDEAIYKIEGNFIGEKNKGGKHWVVSDMTLNYFLKNEFTEYKEPLKYKVGDEVWVKAKVQDVRTDQNYAYPYVLEELSGYYKEEELKGIDE